MKMTPLIFLFLIVSARYSAPSPPLVVPFSTFVSHCEAKGIASPVSITRRGTVVYRYLSKIYTSTIPSKNNDLVMKVMMGEYSL